MKTTIDAVLLGKVQPFGPKGEPSAFRRAPTPGPIGVEALGLAGDEQADLENHGGVDKAIMHYAHDHYAAWRAERPELIAELATPGAFGENLSTTGLTESDVCIADRYRLGTAVVEVSQGRQPCWKLGHRFGDKTMVQAVIRTGRSGWYYRVLTPGVVTVGDMLELVERPNPDWTVARAFALLVGARRERGAIEFLAKLGSLAQSWREVARRRLKNLKD